MIAIFMFFLLHPSEVGIPYAHPRVVIAQHQAGVPSTHRRLP